MGPFQFRAFCHSVTHAGICASTAVMLGTTCFLNVLLATISLVCYQACSAMCFEKEMLTCGGSTTWAGFSCGRTGSAQCVVVEPHRMWASALRGGSCSGWNPSGPEPLRHFRTPKGKWLVCDTVKVMFLASIIPQDWCLSSDWCK